MAKQDDSDDCGVVAIQYNSAGNEVYLHADGPGLRRLQIAISRLADAAEAGRHAHDHLMGPAWGGWELADDPPQSDKIDTMVTVDHIKILAWPNGFDPDTDP